MGRTSSASPRSVVHATFCIERTYPASSAQVFKALTDPAAKANLPRVIPSGRSRSRLANDLHLPESS